MLRPIGLKDINGNEINTHYVVLFKYNDLMDSPFSNSNFGKELDIHRPDACYFHFHKAAEFYPDYGWPDCLFYTVYFLKDGAFIKEEGTDECPYFFSGLDPRFLVYVHHKDRFECVGHVERKGLLPTDV